MHRNYEKNITKLDKMLHILVNTKYWKCQVRYSLLSEIDMYDNKFTIFALVKYKYST